MTTTITGAGFAASQLTGALPAIDGGALTGVGVVLSIHHAIDKAERVRTYTTNPVLWEGSQIVLTPKSASSKFFIMFEPFYECGSPQVIKLKLFRDGVHQTANDNTGNSYYGVGFANLTWDSDNYTTARSDLKTTWDMPSTTAQITYEVRAAVHSGTQVVNMNRATQNVTSGVTKMTIFEYS